VQLSFVKNMMQVHAKNDNSRHISKLQRQGVMAKQICLCVKNIM